MCPLSWVGKVTCWVRSKLSSKMVSSDESLEVGESMWILMSPSNSKRGERVNANVMSSVKSERKEGLGLGGL